MRKLRVIYFVKFILSLTSTETPPTIGIGSVQMRPSQLLVLTVIVASLGCSWGDRSNSSLRPSMPPNVDSVLTASGQPLSSLFEGVSPNPLYAWENLSSVRLPPCTTRKSLIAWLLELLPATKVHAQYMPCMQGWCAGAYWVDQWEECVGGCEGSYNFGMIDYESGGQCDGVRVEDYTGCWTTMQINCPCSWSICNSC